ncbi:MAG: exodeoxyribonuclease V subunit alpha [Desulfoprunum sp.]|nr:exodeoxyribonuclease V subunit alpha [Desulfoprunum sp.]
MTTNVFIPGLLDRHFADFLTARSGLNGEAAGVFQHIVADLSAAMAAGHVCLPVSGEEAEVLRQSPLISTGALTPLVLHGGRLYLHRYFTYEHRLAAQLLELSERSYEVDNLAGLLDSFFTLEDGETDWQRQAAEVALQWALCIVTGGPGTGKTYTVAKIIALLLKAYGPGLRLALAAPTGKAAMRLRESLGRGLADLALPADLASAVPAGASTLHRLLGVRPDSPAFRHGADNPLPYDVVVVDEASMVDLAMMSKLVDALPPGARLILLGDRDQLASVESGAVLADCSRALPDNTVELQRTFRFDAGIKRLASLVNEQNAAQAWRLLETGEFANVRLVRGPSLQHAVDRYFEYMRMVAEVSDEAHYPQVFALFNRFRILCAVRQGARGVIAVNQAIERGLQARGCRSSTEETWYPGRPVLITCNDYSLDLFNGDIGICLPDPTKEGRIKVWFERPDGHLRSFLSYRLPQCETVFAMTIHKSQGSEFDEVLIVLPDQDNPVLSRELVYTAITRAKKEVAILAEEEILQAALGRSIERASGLAEMLCQGMGVD